MVPERAYSARAAGPQFTNSSAGGSTGASEQSQSISATPTALSYPVADRVPSKAWSTAVQVGLAGSGLVGSGKGCPCRIVSAGLIWSQKLVLGTRLLARST